MGVRLTVVGSSPAWPNPGGAQSGYLVEGPGALLLDCGPGVLARLRAMNGGWPRVDAIVITHWHLDHWGDLVPWTWGNLVGPGRDRERPELWLPPQGIERLRDFGSRLGWEDMFESAFAAREYREREPFSTAAGLQVTAIRLPHYALQAYGLRVTNDARTIAYSGDSGPDQRLVELARGADLFLCEATLERGEVDGSPRGHLSAEEAVAAFRASGARKLLLTHRPQELPAPAGYEVAHDGLALDL
ncbi:MAG: MBL fold metallo-hydrolase [Thermoleophilia bacterium]